MNRMNGLWLATIVAVTIAGAGCASTRTQRSAGESIDDTVILTKVKADLAADPVAKATQIDVEVYKGVVQLNGFVDSQANRDRAGQVARQVAGVTQVKNNLQVQTAERSAGVTVDDQTVTAKVKAALVDAKVTKADQINIETRNGVVQLSGFVDSAEAKAAAERIARGVNGVSGVSNKITVK